jgi:putative intracellular protease/amidase
VIVAGGKGAMTVAEDAFARELIAHAAAQGKTVAALGAGRRVLERAGVSGFVSVEAEDMLRHLCARLGSGASGLPRDRRASLTTPGSDARSRV